MSMLPSKLLMLVEHLAAAFGKAMMFGSCIELRDLGLEMLIDEQQRPQCATKIAVATRHDFIDRGFT